jgi:hypothetical protein
VKKSFSFHLFLSVLCLALIIFSASCKKPCKEPDVDALNAIYLQFDTSGEPGSFTSSELDSLYMVRYQQAVYDSFIFPVDTLNLFALELSPEGYRVRISRDYPVGLPEGPPYYTDYMYQFQGYGENFNVRLQNIVLDGSYTEDCIYISRKKGFVLNNDTLDVTGSMEYVLILKD